VLDALRLDAAYGLRMLRRSPGFATVAALSLAFSMGAGTAVFSALDALMLRPLPVNRPEELVTFRQLLPNGSTRSTFSFADYEELQRRSESYASVAAVHWTELYQVTAGRAGEAADEEPARAGLVTGNYFSVLGVRALIGRTFGEGEDLARGGYPAAVISHGYWQRRFGLAPDVVGRTLAVGRATFTITGVTPRGFSGEWVGSPADFWIPMEMACQVRPDLPADQCGRRLAYAILARLKPGWTPQQAGAAAEALIPQLLRNPPSPPGLLAGARFEVAPAGTGYSPQRDSFRQPLTILIIAVGAVHLIACANVAGLLLIRNSRRQREMALRAAIGASRPRLVRQMLTEGLLLAVLGSAAGLVLAQWGAVLLGHLLRSGPVGGSELALDLDLRMDVRALGFTMGLGLLTGLLFGLTPALWGAQLSLSPWLAGRGAVVPGSARLGMRKLLVITQVAVSLAVLVAAGLLVRTLRNLHAEELGFSRGNLLLAWTLPGQSGRRPADFASLWRTVQEKVAALPGVTSASLSTTGLLTGDELSGTPVVVEGQAPGTAQDARALPKTVGPAFFETVGQRLLAGRDFTARDTPGSTLVTIVNESFARHFFGGENPVGRRIRAGSSSAPPLEIVGVVTNAKYLSPREDRGRAMFYYPYTQIAAGGLRRMCLVVRAAGDPVRLAASVRAELRNTDRNLPVIRIDTVERQLDDLLFQERLIARLLGFFGAAAVVLACLGLYGVVAWSVVQRTGEIGIRLALGAPRARILGMVLRESLVLAGAGIALGVPVTVGATRLISTRLFGVGPADPLVLGGAVVLMSAAVTLASLLPACRASRVDPMLALRYE
jgi:predicted permease